MQTFENFPKQYLPLILTMFAILMALAIMVFCFYLSNLQRLLKAIRPVNRKMQPGQVWLMVISFLSSFIVIPQLVYGNWEGNTLLLSMLAGYAIRVFVLVFQFYMVNKIADSIEAEYRSRNLQVEPRPTYQLGLFYCICSAAGLVADVPYIGFIAGLAGVAGFVAWIMYWVKTAEWKRNIEALPLHDDPDSELFKDLY